MLMRLEEQLESLLAAFQSGTLSFDDFSRAFSDAYLDGADDLPETDHTRLFDAIHERLEWTTAAPPDEDRAWGWGDPSDFRKWLTSVRR